ncbi:MAG: hypothetical protein M1818_007333 [Claussenomyces sp. TS43310]|nr:MAG: hypothetical protein M1818_007333 [Claussenomyces sp. TS43310]
MSLPGAQDPIDSESLRSRRTVYKHKEADPPPLGVSASEWNRLYSAADSRIYARSHKDSTKSKQARLTGLTRQEALDVLAKKRLEDPHYFPLPQQDQSLAPLTTSIPPSSSNPADSMPKKKTTKKGKDTAPAILPDIASAPPTSASLLGSPGPTPVPDSPHHPSAMENQTSTHQTDNAGIPASPSVDQILVSMNTAPIKSKRNYRARPKKTARTMTKAAAPAGSVPKSSKVKRVVTQCDYEKGPEAPSSPKTPDSEAGSLPHLPASPTTPTGRTYEPSDDDDGVKSPQENDDNESFEGSNDGGTYCICRGPDDHSKMVQCESCEEWYHIRCIEMKEWWYALLEHYFCPKCVTADRRCLYKRTCRLPTCRSAARAELIPDGRWKYCSDQHLDKWAQSMVAKAGPGTDSNPGGAINRRQLKHLMDQVSTAAEFHALGKKPHIEGIRTLDKPEYGDCGEDVDDGDKDMKIAPATKVSHIKNGGGPRKGNWISLSELRKKAAMQGTSEDAGVSDIQTKDKSTQLDPKSEAKTTLNSNHSEDAPAAIPVSTEAITQYIVSLETLQDGRLHDWLGQYLTEEEMSQIAGFNAQREAIIRKRHIFEKNEKLISFVKGKANRALSKIKAIDGRKDICGYDRILAKNEDELDAWLKSDVGVETFINGQLADPIIDESLVDQEQVDGMCLRKRCTSHIQWFKLHMQDTRFEVAELTKQDLKLDQLELAIFETVETRVLLENA